MPESVGQQLGARIAPHLDALFRAAYRLTGNTPDAQDLVQDTCVRAFTKAEAFAASDVPLAWLMRVQYNLFIDGARARRRENIRLLDQVDLSALEADAASRPDESASQQQGLTTLQRAFNQLKREHRALLALRVEGYSPTEIQAMTGLKLNVINARLHRARKRLAKLLRAEADAQVPDDRMEVRR